MQLASAEMWEHLWSMIEECEAPEKTRGQEQKAMNSTARIYTVTSKVWLPAEQLLRFVLYELPFLTPWARFAVVILSVLTYCHKHAKLAGKCSKMLGT